MVSTFDARVTLHSCRAFPCRASGTGVSTTEGLLKRADDPSNQRNEE